MDPEKKAQTDLEVARAVGAQLAHVLKAVVIRAVRNEPEDEEAALAEVYRTMMTAAGSFELDWIARVNLGPSTKDRLRTGWLTVLQALVVEVANELGIKAPPKPGSH